MPPFPNFQNATTFPSFAACPLATDAPEPPKYVGFSVLDDIPLTTYSHYLIATVQDDMTFSDTPTFICKDRENVAFALKLHVTGSSSDVSRLKKGVTVVVKGAERSGVADGKQGFVGALVDEVQVCILCVLLYLIGYAVRLER